jgi:hypothetical protein
LSGYRLVSRTRTGDQKNQANNSERRAVAHDLAGAEIFRGAESYAIYCRFKPSYKFAAQREWLLTIRCSQAELLLRLTQVA